MSADFPPQLVFATRSSGNEERSSRLHLPRMPGPRRNSETRAESRATLSTGIPGKFDRRPAVRSGLNSGLAAALRSGSAHSDEKVQVLCEHPASNSAGVACVWGASQRVPADRLLLAFHIQLGLLLLPITLACDLTRQLVTLKGQDKLHHPITLLNLESYCVSRYLAVRDFMEVTIVLSASPVTTSPVCFRMSSAEP